MEKNKELSVTPGLVIITFLYPVPVVHYLGDCKQSMIINAIFEAWTEGL